MLANLIRQIDHAKTYTQLVLKKAWSDKWGNSLGCLYVGNGIG